MYKTVKITSFTKMFYVTAVGFVCFSCFVFLPVPYSQCTSSFLPVWSWVSWNVMKCDVMLPKHLKTIASTRANYTLRTHSNPRPPQVYGRFSAACNPKTDIAANAMRSAKKNARNLHLMGLQKLFVFSVCSYHLRQIWIFGNGGRLKRVSGEKHLGQAKKGRVSCQWSSGADEFRSDKLHFVLWKVRKGRAETARIFQVRKVKDQKVETCTTQLPLNSWRVDTRSKSRQESKKKQRVKNQKNAKIY